MMPGYWPGPSGQTAKVGILPYLVVTMTSCSSIAGILRFRRSMGAAASLDCAVMSRGFARNGLSATGAAAAAG